jgi:hypothetical protein
MAEVVERTTIFVALARRYEWVVRLQADTGTVVEFTTTSEDARAIFKWRDKPPTGGRRPALRHWVSRLGTTRDREPWYLRGAVDFVWEGLGCQLLPPQFEREKAIARKVL